MATSTMKIELNGTLINGRIDGIEKFSVTIRRSDEDGRLSKSFSSELTFFDDGYQILKTILIDDPNGFANKVDVKIYDSCCRESVFVGIIEGNAIDWCEPGCSITANLIEDEQLTNCIKSTLIGDNWNGFLNGSRPPIRYCIESRPEWLQYALIFLSYGLIQIFTMLVFSILPTLLLLVGIVFLICNLIRIICFGISIRFRILGRTIRIRIGPFCDPPDCDEPYNNPLELIEFIQDAFEQIITYLIPCGRFHPSPYVRDYIKNVCEKCGLQFDSTILNDPSSPYYNLVLFSNPVEKGRAKDSGNYSVINANVPIETLETLMNDYLKPMFNAEFRIFGNIFKFERKDFFLTTTTWIDTEQLLENDLIIDNEICYNWIDKQRWAFARYEYQPDAQELCGNEFRNRYNDIIDWNVPYNPAQSGQFIRSIPSSPARHRDDDGDQNVFDFFQEALGGLINIAYYGAFSNYDKVLLMSQHRGFNYKFLIFDTTEFEKGLIQHYYPDSYIGGNIPDIGESNRFNYPMWFLAGYQNNLYSNFQYIDDPRLPGSVNFEFKFTFKFDCQQYFDFGFDKNVKLVKGNSIVNGIVTEINVDFINRTIQVNGIV